MIDLVTRLRDWEHIYPCDDLKPDGHLYIEAAERIEELEAKLEISDANHCKCGMWVLMK
jgi:hypothetical protein